MAYNRSTFGFIFTATLAAVFLIVTGLIGYQPPAHLSLDAATWRLGVWTDEVILSQVALGVALLTAAAVVVVRVNRRLAQPIGQSRRKTLAVLEFPAQARAFESGFQSAADEMRKC